MTRLERRREGRRIRRRAQGLPYWVTITIVPDLSDFPLIYAISPAGRHFIGEYREPARKPLIHNGRKHR